MSDSRWSEFVTVDTCDFSTCSLRQFNVLMFYLPVKSNTIIPCGTGFEPTVVAEMKDSNSGLPARISNRLQITDTQLTTEKRKIIIFCQRRDGIPHYAGRRLATSCDTIICLSKLLYEVVVHIFRFKLKVY